MPQTPLERRDPPEGRGGSCQKQSVQREDFLGKLASLRMASRRRGELYPNKPLFLLWPLGRMQQQGRSACTYEEADKLASRRLLDDFGPPSVDRYGAAMPFVHLVSDLW
jgi:hypothetical protein